MKKARCFKTLSTVSLLALLAAACATGADSGGNADAGYWKSLLNIKPAERVVEASSSVSGSYLSGRFAQHAQDWQAASIYMSKVLESDEGNSDLLQRTFLLTLGTGDTDMTQALAEKIMQAGSETELAAVYLAADALAQESYARAEKYIAMLPDTGFGRYTRPLLEAWNLAGQNESEKAIAVLTAENNRFIPLYILHAGFVAEYSGRTEEAQRWFEEAMAAGLSTRSILSIGAFYERNGQADKAQLLYATLKKQQSQSLFIEQALERVRQGKTAPISSVSSAREGAALAMFDLAALLYERDAYESAMIYGRLAQHLSPDSALIHMMMGDIMAAFGRYDEAVYKYSRVGDNKELSWISRLRAAETLELSGRTDEALKLLSEMLREKPADIDVLIQIGDIHRRNEKYDLAVRAYDTAAQRFESGKVPPEYWNLAYARGIALERVKDWPRAEKDLLQALEYQPDNPMIMNYLGYSWADQGINIDKALEMIKRAIVLRPDDGYIVDSYGWALYKAGDYKKSVMLLEKAVEYVPNDPVINDHLGDAYWKVDRRLEAQFQWQRALDLTKNASEREVLQIKIRSGPKPARMVNTEAHAH